MPVLKFLIPFLSALVLCAVQLSPVLANTLLITIPLLPIAALFYWASNGQEPPTGVTAFCCGLFVDAATAGPLGYWALVYLFSVFLAAESGKRITPTLLARWMAFGISLFVITIIAWLLAGLLSREVASLWVFMQTAIGVFVVYPLVHVVLEAITPWKRPHRAAHIP